MPEKYSTNRFLSTLSIETKPCSKSLAGATILYIDDDYVNYLYFCELLKESGVRLHRVCSRDQAVNYMALHTEISIVMVSSTIAQITCYEIIRLSKSICPNVPVMTILETRDKIIEQACINAGSNIYFTRFLDHMNLIESLSELLIPYPQYV